MPSPGAIHLTQGDTLALHSPISQTAQMITLLELDVLLRSERRNEVLACHGILFTPVPLIVGEPPRPARKRRRGPSFRARQAAGRAARRETVSGSAN